MSVGICATGLPGSPMLVTDMSVSVSGTRADLIARVSIGEHLIGENTTPHLSDNIDL